MRGTFRVRGDVVEIFPAGSWRYWRFAWSFSEMRVDRITEMDVLTGED